MNEIVEAKKLVDILESGGNIPLEDAVYLMYELQEKQIEVNVPPKMKKLREAMTLMLEKIINSNHLESTKMN